jgi:MULE transposase domain
MATVAHVLKPGLSTATLEDLQGAWMKYNKEIFDIQMMIIRSEPKINLFKSGCASFKGTTEESWRNFVKEGGCTAHIFVIKASRRKHDSEGCFVKSINMNHTCNGENCLRQRNYNYKYWGMASDVIKYHVASQFKGAKNLQETAGNAGIKLSDRQCQNIVAIRNGRQLKVHIGQYFLLTSLFEQWQRMDPQGTYLLDTKQTSWTHDDQHLTQFHRAYVAMSASKRAWLVSGATIMFCDGTFTKSPHFKHVLMFAVTMDGNNKTLLLAYAVVFVENKDNWLWFLQALISDFPGIQVIQSDADKGIRSGDCKQLLQLHNILPGRCVYHMYENCKKDCTVKMEYRGKVFDLAKACTLEGYQKKKDELSQMGNGANDVAQWFHARKNEYATHGR